MAGCTGPGADRVRCHVAACSLLDPFRAHRAPPGDNGRRSIRQEKACPSEPRVADARRVEGRKSMLKETLQRTVMVGATLALLSAGLAAKLERHTRVEGCRALTTQSVLDIAVRQNLVRDGSETPLGIRDIDGVDDPQELVKLV